MATPYLTTKQAAELVGEGVSSRTIVAWIHAGRLKASRDLSQRGRFRILPDDLRNALESWNTQDAA